MEVPTLKRSNRLSYEQGGAPHDVQMAGTAGRAIASIGGSLQQLNSSYDEFNRRADASEKALAIKDAEAEFDIFKANFEQYLIDNRVVGSKYREEYEKQYTEFSNQYLERNKTFTEEVGAVLKTNFTSGLLDVQTRGLTKRAIDLQAKNLDIRNKNLVAIQQNPATFQKKLLDYTELTFARADAGEIHMSDAQSESETFAKEASVSAVNGYVMAKNYRNAKAFLKQAEVAAMLGTEKQAELYEQVERKEAEDYTRRANMEDREYNLQKRALEEEQNKTFVNMLQTAHYAESPAQLQLLERDILKQAQKMGISATQTKGLLTKTDDKWQDIDSTSDMRIAQRLANINSVDDLTTIERDITKAVAGKTMLHDTGTKWFNVIRGLRSQSKVDPRTVQQYKAYRLKLTGYLPQADKLTGTYANDNDKLKATSILSDFDLITASGTSPRDAFDSVIRQHAMVVSEAKGYSKVLGRPVKDFDDISEAALQLQDFRESKIYNDDELRTMEIELLDAKNYLLMLQDLQDRKNSAPLDNLTEQLFVSPQAEQLSTPVRRK